jgi:Ion channel
MFGRRLAGSKKIDHWIESWSVLTAWALIQLVDWIEFWQVPRRGHDTYSALQFGLLFLGSLVFLAIPILWIGIAISAPTMDPLKGVITFVLTLSYVVVTSSRMYYALGDSSNFSHALSHLDAVLLAVGTLTTAGTADIVATSERARALVLCQQVVDFALVVFVATLFVARIQTWINADANDD